MLAFAPAHYVSMRASMRYRLHRHLGFILMLVIVSLAPVALAGEDPIECHQAELTMDGRYALLRPGCIIDAALDLRTGELLTRQEAQSLKASTTFMPLRRFTEKSAFGRWMSREWYHGDSSYAWVSFTLPNTDWLLRYRARGPVGDHAVIHRKAVQYAPIAAYRAAHASKKRRAAPSHNGPLPALGPYGTKDPADLSHIIRTETVSKRKRKKITKTYSYKPTAFAEAVPTFGDFLRHASMTWKNVRSEGGSTGWKVTAFAPQGFWSALGMQSPRFRVVDTKESIANDALHTLYEALRDGKPARVRTFRPYTWTVHLLNPVPE